MGTSALTDEQGFTLLELAVVAVVTTVLLSLSFFAVRHFWLVRQLQGAQDQVAEQMREAQQRSAAESHPLVYGVWFLKGTSTWGVARYSTSSATCTVVQTYAFDSGLTVNAATTTFSPVAGLTSGCQSVTPGATAANYAIAFFYARGSATAGSVQLDQPATGRTKVVSVTPLTGRVVRS